MNYAFAPPEIASTSVRTSVRVRFEDENANMTSTVLKQVRRDEGPRFVQVPQPARAADWTGEDFKVLAAREPSRLVALVAKGRLADHDLTYAAEALGLVTDTNSVAAVLVPLTRHASPVVREGVIYGLSRHVSASPVVRAALERLAADDPSPGVREAATEALDP